MYTSNFKEDIEIAVGEDAILAVVILDPNISTYTKDSRNLNPALCNIPLSWEQAAPLLDYSYESGFGSMDCHDILVYTQSDVYYIHEYDGSTDIHSVPRNPPTQASNEPT